MNTTSNRQHFSVQLFLPILDRHLGSTSLLLSVQVISFVACIARLFVDLVDNLILNPYLVAGQPYRKQALRTPLRPLIELSLARLPACTCYRLPTLPLFTSALPSCAFLRSFRLDHLVPTPLTPRS